MHHRETTDRRTKGQDSRRRRGERGQSLVEMAVAVPILILLVAAMIDASRIFDALIVLTQAAREGARLATVQDDPPLTESDIITLVKQDVLGSGTNITRMTDEALVVVVLLANPTEARVTVSYEFSLWFGGMLGIPTIEVSREAVMPMYYPPPGG